MCGGSLLIDEVDFGDTFFLDVPTLSGDCLDITVKQGTAIVERL
jgi:hypothetical protein